MDDDQILRHRRYRHSTLDQVLSISELRWMALHRLPSIASEYLEGGSDDEIALVQNRSAFRRWTFEPRLENGSPPAPRHSGRLDALAFPYIIAPTGLNGLYWPKADMELATAAAQAGVIYTQSTVSNSSLDEVAQLPGLAHWFQLYLFSDMQFVESLMARARAAGVETLVVTVDANIFGNREWNARLYRVDGRANWRAKLDVLRHPGWAMRVAAPGLPEFPNLSDWLGKGQDLIGASAWIRSNMAPRVTWRQLEQVRALWPGQMLIKGIGHCSDARQAMAIGADGVVLGNHGGRQLDEAVPGLRLLPEVRDALGQKAMILVEGGVRRGSDILKARLLGADAVMGGRATLYGLAAGGSTGVIRALTIMRNEYERCCALLGDGELRKD